jgi:hypothetical protein
MPHLRTRLRRLEDRRPPKIPPAELDLSRLSAAHLERAAELRERIDQVGIDGLTPDELMACAEIRDLLEGASR